MADALVCGGSVRTASLSCQRGQCTQCGFKQLWSCFLRKELVGADGLLLPDAPPEWQHTIRWETLKSGGTTPSADGSSASEQTLR
eukprot:5493440-Pleurochrysis_carterae.AAC.1